MREVRAVKVDDAEVRKDSDSGALKFTGHAAVFNQRTWIGPKKWGFYEEVAEGFFDDVLDDRAAFLVNHDPNIVLARNGSTMTLATDKKGLVPEAEWDPADPDAVKWAGRVRRGDVSEMSFAFTVAEEKWAEDDDGNEIRTLLKAERLYDVSLVTYPAYEGTDGAMRDAAAAEVVKRHRGVDPRSERATHQGQEPEPVVNPIVQTEPAPIDAPSPNEVIEASPEPAPAEPEGRNLRAMRHKALAVRYRLPL
jgi:hypothetical protein